ncbi:MAG: hypothetical protein HYY62_09210 [Deltaproteobacteria bacterium]|nr:hypothetical protein [Deltaproteobacteria bacterium]
MNCASTPKSSRPARKPIPRTQTQQAPSATPESQPYTYEEVWHAIYQTSLPYSLKDFSKEEGTVESNWIYDSGLSRYRFFITIDHTTSPIEWTIDIQGQDRASEQASWKWIAPSLDKEENIQNTIYENLEKNRTS